MLSERSSEMQKDLYVAYINYEKAFDRVKHAELFKELSKHQIDGKDLRLLKNLGISLLVLLRFNNAIKICCIISVKSLKNEHNERR